jgi:hypothetical protein
MTRGSRPAVVTPPNQEKIAANTIAMTKSQDRFLFHVGLSRAPAGRFSFRRLRGVDLHLAAVEVHAAMVVACCVLSSGTKPKTVGLCEL